MYSLFFILIGQSGVKNFSIHNEIVYATADPFSLYNTLDILFYDADHVNPDSPIGLN